MYCFYYSDIEFILLEICSTLSFLIMFFLISLSLILGVMVSVLNTLLKVCSALPHCHSPVGVVTARKCKWNIVLLVRNNNRWR